MEQRQEIEYLSVDNKNVPFVCTSMIGDGACVFRSLAYIVFNNANEHLLVRRQIVDYVLANWSEYNSYILQHASANNSMYKHYNDKYDYQIDMMNPKTYATYVEIVAASSLYQLHLYVYQNRQLLYEVGDIQHESHYLKFSSGANASDLDNGHMDVYTPVSDETKCENNNLNIKYNYILFLNNVLITHKNLTNEYKNTLDTLLTDATTNFYDNTINVQSKSLTLDKLICGFVNIYNSVNDSEPINLDETFCDRLQVQQGNNESVIDNRQSVSSNFGNSMDDVAVNNQTRYVQNLAAITVKVTNENRQQFNVDRMELAKFKSISEYTKTNLTNIPLDSLENNLLFVITLDVLDVRYQALLQKFIKTYGIETQSLLLTKQFQSELFKQINSVDVSKTLRTVKQALIDFNYTQNIEPITIIFTLDRQDFNLITNNTILHFFYNYNEKVMNIKFIFVDVKSNVNNVRNVDDDTMQIDFGENDNNDYMSNVSETTNLNVRVASNASAAAAVSTTDDDDKFIANVRNASMARRKRKLRQKYNSIFDSQHGGISRPRSADTQQDDVSMSLTMMPSPGPQLLSPTVPDLPPLPPQNTMPAQNTIITRSLDLPEIQKMPVYFQRIISMISTNIHSSLLTCPTPNLSVVPNYYNFADTMQAIKNIDILALDKTVPFYSMMLPLSLYGDTFVSESTCIWFVNKAAQYFCACIDNYKDIVKIVENDDDRDRYFIFMVIYNFLWHYKIFIINNLTDKLLTSFKNQKILNVINIYNNFVQKRFTSINLDFPVKQRVPATYIHVNNSVIQLMVQQFIDSMPVSAN
uniref:Vp80 n=1 Tax=Ectropis obliqua nucleopolyhedrovirus TaxID=59376 RepID=A0A8F2T9L5_9ABAC|nr:Vp80 [Ectropis obliqua nucleopolyhedrovirus]